MSGQAGARHASGFTLIEVLVALVVVAFGVGAMMATLTAAADNVAHLRDKSFAEWIALNQISELRLAIGTPTVGESSGDVDYAGQKWRWNRVVTDQGVAEIYRIEITVGRPGADDEEGPALATAWGFIGRKVAPATGFDPDWSLQSNAKSLGGDDDAGGADTQAGAQ